MYVFTSSKDKRNKTITSILSFLLPLGVHGQHDIHVNGGVERNFSGRGSFQTQSYKIVLSKVPAKWCLELACVCWVLLLWFNPCIISHWHGMRLYTSVFSALQFVVVQVITDWLDFVFKEVKALLGWYRKFCNLNAWDMRHFHICQLGITWAWAWDGIQGWDWGPCHDRLTGAMVRWIPWCRFHPQLEFISQDFLSFLSCDKRILRLQISLLHNRGILLFYPSYRKSKPSLWRKISLSFSSRLEKNVTHQMMEKLVAQEMYVYDHQMVVSHLQCKEHVFIFDRIPRLFCIKVALLAFASFGLWTMLSLFFFF